MLRAVLEVDSLQNAYLHTQVMESERSATASLLFCHKANQTHPPLLNITNLLILIKDIKR